MQIHTQLLLILVTITALALMLTVEHVTILSNSLHFNRYILTCYLFSMAEEGLISL